jgi:hypothetical protein
MQQYPDRVVEVPVESNAIFIDYDTPQALAKLDSNAD